MNWADDPEIVAIFRAEVEERVASLTAGLLALEGGSATPEALKPLLGYTHQIKGSARMYGADAVVTLAHRSEDVLGALRDGRITLDSALIDLLLLAFDGITRQLPGVDDPLPADHVDAVAAALAAARDGESFTVPGAPEPAPAPVPAPAEPESSIAAPEPLIERRAAPRTGDRDRSGEVVRIPTARVHSLVDAVGEAEQRARAVSRAAAATSDAVAAARRKAAAGADSGSDAAAVLEELLATLEGLSGAAESSRLEAADATERLAVVRHGAMALAMVPVRRVVANFPQLVREVATGSGKEVELVLEGTDVELDARVLDGVADALRHLVINAVDHGCETPTARVAAGKPARATVAVRARAAGAAVVVEVSDDGAGIVGAPADAAAEAGSLLDLICRPGFTTRSTVTETSGRGVGLDVVRGAVEDLGGTLQLQTEPGTGSTFTMTLPVTVGVMRCLVAQVGTQRYAVPVANVTESVDLAGADIHDVAGRLCLRRQGELVPLASMAAALGLARGKERTAVVIRRSGDRGLFGWAVDELLEEREFVVKDLGAFVGRHRLYPGAALDEDGRVLLLLDPRELAVHGAARAELTATAPVAEAPPQAPDPAVEPAPATVPSDPDQRPRVLVVEDSAGMREMERKILEGAGYDVALAVDGSDGVSRLTGDPVDLVLSDVEMPGMDGFNLTRTIRRTPGWESVPVVIMTSRGEPADQRAGLDAGADAYLLKSTFNSAELISTVRRLVGR